MTFGCEIRRRREAAGLSLRRMAERIDVSPAYLSRVERGLVPPSEVLLRAAARVLRADAEELLLLGGRIPASWRKAIVGAPARTVEILRQALPDCTGEPSAAYSRTVLAFQGTRALEDANFPFERLSEIAEIESWRKEISRPVYHIHKWWAQRLGSVFRAILLAAFAPKGTDLMEMFYQPARLQGAVVYDPFMGSGTTIGEALKLGARAIGRDINPVAYFAVKNALAVHSRQKIIETFHSLERDVAPLIRRFYRSRLPNGASAETLYYFWVMVVACPQCGQSVDLFSSRVFAQHAYPGKNPLARAVCPGCGGINAVRYDAETATCAVCRSDFSPQDGPAKGAKATCPFCSHQFSIVRTVQAHAEPPSYRLYAKLVLCADGSKHYLPADEYDRSVYEKASRTLEKHEYWYPIVPLQSGYNTDQALNYCYRHWHQMFNRRQLLCLGLLADRIKRIRDVRIRDLFTCLFSGTLEFNNMFASFKGEGTGAVRHMFSHHILKPERTPLEANPWGTPKSSGSFSTLFESRILRALDYCSNPFELRLLATDGKTRTEKIYGLSCQLGHDTADTFAEFTSGKSLYLSCGDSSVTDLAPQSIDAVVTDPPFFDNVHYSQLADFFYVWQSHILSGNGIRLASTTRSSSEVQTSDSSAFAERLRRVWIECHRVLRPDGLLVFTYHHSRPEGWRAILDALLQAGFMIVAAHPIKAEMSVAQPKHQAKEPIDLDVILVCRKHPSTPVSRPEHTLSVAVQVAKQQVVRFNSLGRQLSRNDVRVVVMAQVIKNLSWQSSTADSLAHLDSRKDEIERAIDEAYYSQKVAELPRRNAPRPQLALW